MEQSNDNSIFMEGLVFGAGCCGLQTTFQMDNLDEARFLYDQLVNICPIMVCLWLLWSYLNKPMVQYSVSIN